MVGQKWWLVTEKEIKVRNSIEMMKEKKLVATVIPRRTNYACIL